MDNVVGFNSILKKMNNIYTGPGQGARLTQIALFKEIWIRSDKRSYITGLHLREFQSTPLFLNCFAHVLAKGQNKYPRFKYLAANIVLLTPAEHALLDQATEEARISYALDIEQRTRGTQTAEWDKLKDLEEKLKKLYKEKFPHTYANIIGYKYSPEEEMAIVGTFNKQYFRSLNK